MKILQVQFKNRNGHTLRGIVTLPDTEGKVPFVVHLHGFAGSCSGYKSMYPICPALWQRRASAAPGSISTATARATASSRI